MTPKRRYLAEALGTFWLVFGGCGSALISASYPDLGIGFLGVSLAFGLTVVTAAYALGFISGGHFNPAVTIGVAAANKFPRREVPPYILSQLGGAFLASAALFVIASGTPSFDVTNGFASNGYGANSPGGYGMGAAFLVEFLTTAAFIFLILGITSQDAIKGVAPLAIGLTLTLIHLISIPVTNTSVNPARSTGPALFAGGWAVQQLWLFWVAPILGGAAAGITYRWFVQAPSLRGAPPHEQEERPLKRASGQ